MPSLRDARLLFSHFVISLAVFASIPDLPFATRLAQLDEFCAIWLSLSGARKHSNIA
jgi:hypothetical protein